MRIAEIDSARGVGVILMVLYHVAYDLDFFNILTISLRHAPWIVIARITQIIFIITAGMTFFYSSSNVYRRLRRVVILFGLAMMITFVTWLFFGEQGVKFGILHFFAVSMLITIPLKKLGVWNSLIGIFILFAGFFIGEISGPWWLFPLGLHAPNFQSLDYFPLIPWYGLFLQGVAVGALLRHSPLIKTDRYRPLFRIKFLEKIGRHSLFIYLFHQPIIAGLIVMSHAL